MMSITSMSTAMSGTEPNPTLMNITTSLCVTAISTFRTFITNTGTAEQLKGVPSGLLRWLYAPEGAVEKQVVRDLHASADEQRCGKRCPLHEKTGERGGESPPAESDQLC